MSKKKKDKQKQLVLVKPEEQKEATMAEMAHALYHDILLKKYNCKNTIITNDIEVVAFVESGKEESDDIVCYTISPASNRNVSIYVDDKVVNVEYNKKILSPTLDEIAYLVDNIIFYLDAYFSEVA